MTDTRARILVADDEPGMRDLFEFLLEPLGYEVVTVADGLAALRWLAQHDCDLVILDVHMPRMTGPETLPQIRELHPAQKVLIVSGGSDADHIFENQLREEGISICLLKPFDVDEIVDAVTRTCHGDTPPTTGASS